jgi:hypothetical protein
MKVTKESMRNRVCRDWFKGCLDVLGECLTRMGNLKNRAQAELLYEVCAEAGHLGEYDRAWAQIVGDWEGDCPRCKGRKTIKCTKCNGEGETVCGECGAMKECENCDPRSRHIVCPVCDGAGFREPKVAEALTGN